MIKLCKITTIFCISIENVEVQYDQLPAIYYEPLDKQHLFLKMLWRCTTKNIFY